MSQHSYRNYIIYHESENDWRFFHRDLNGIDDERCGFAESLGDAKAEIDLLDDVPYDLSCDKVQYG